MYLTISVDSWDQPAAQTRPKASRQMERRAMTQPHLLGCGMIHVATDDGYSFITGQRSHKYTLMPIDDKVTASLCRANLGTRHSSLSETSTLYLISRSDLGLSFTVSVLS